MVNDFNAVSTNDLLIKFADDLAISLPVEFNSTIKSHTEYADDLTISAPVNFNSVDTSRIECTNIQQ